jgi:predicted Holliday junction resolvase-like endonuclease
MELVIILLALGLLVAAWLGYLVGRATAQRRVAAETAAIRQDAVKRSRAVLSGQFSEQLAPFLPGFPWRPTEARFIGKPVDFIVFKGMDEQEISEIVFVEVKARDSQLSPQERKLRDAVLAKRVSWHEYRVPDALTGDQHEKS